MTIQMQIEQKLQTAFTPSYLQVVNESHMHNVPDGAESHFKVIIVSDKFKGQRLLMRHRAVNNVLAVELAKHIHALAMHTYTDLEWEETHQIAPLSPKCRGGEKSS